MVNRYKSPNILVCHVPVGNMTPHKAADILNKHKHILNHLEEDYRKVVFSPSLETGDVRFEILEVEKDKKAINRKKWKKNGKRI